MGVIRDIQDEQKVWAEHNFAKRQSWHSLLGVQEEVGELAHAHLKATQRIRGRTDYRVIKDMKKDAIGDIIIFLMDYCNQEDICMESTLRDVWSQVRVRDWKKFPENGYNK